MLTMLEAFQNKALQYVEVHHDASADQVLMTVSCPSSGQSAGLLLTGEDEQRMVYDALARALNDPAGDLLNSIRSRVLAWDALPVSRAVELEAFNAMRAIYLLLNEAGLVPVEEDAA